jgi:hypothetical protein
MIGDGDCGDICGIKIGRGNRSTRRKPASAPLCPPQIHMTRPGYENYLLSNLFYKEEERFITSAAHL